MIFFNFVPDNEKKNHMTPNWLKNWIQIYNNGGFKSLIKEKGWIVGVVIFMFFFLKGMLWLIIPYLIAKGLF